MRKLQESSSNPVLPTPRVRWRTRDVARNLDVAAIRQRLEYLPVASITKRPANGRTHSAKQVGAIAASIKSRGFLGVLLVDARRQIVVGEARFDAAIKAGLQTVPVISIEHLTEAEIETFRIAENTLTAGSGWDPVVLGERLEWLQEQGVDLALTAIAKSELASIANALERARLTTLDGEDDGAALVKSTAVVRGDLFVLGDHLLKCGDATSEDDVASLLQGRRPKLMVTDVPYGVEYDGTWRVEAGVSNTSRIGSIANDDRIDWSAAYALFDGDVVYVWHAGLHEADVVQHLRGQDFQIRSQIVWSKPGLVLGRGDYHWQHEPCLYAVRRGAKGHWQGARDQTTVWAIGSDTKNEDAATTHPTQKPVECMRRPILNNSARGDDVYDPFAGSGSTVIAAETTGRKALAIEIDPVFCEAIIDRWQRVTGKIATHVESGISFPELRRKRLAEGSSAPANNRADDGCAHG